MQNVGTGVGSPSPQPVCTGIIARLGDQLYYVAVEVTAGLVMSVLHGTSSKCLAALKSLHCISMHADAAGSHQ